MHITREKTVTMVLPFITRHTSELSWG